MNAEFNAETIAIIVGVLTLMFGVWDARRTHRQTLREHRLQIILSISESFRNRWESGWERVLLDLGADHRGPGPDTLPEEHGESVRHMLNWVDWLGALKGSGAMDDISIITSSIGVPLRRILNAGGALIREDIRRHGADYWQNLMKVAGELDPPWKP